MIVMFGILYSESLVLLYQCFLFYMEFVKLSFLALEERDMVLHGRICFAFGNITVVAFVALTHPQTMRMTHLRFRIKN